MRYAILCSPDSSMLKKRANELAELFFKEKNKKKKEHIFWGDENLNAEFYEILTSNPLSLDPQADFVLLRKADQMNAEEWKKISDIVGSLREDAFIILCIESEWDNYFGKLSLKLPLYITNQLCYSYAEKKAWIERIKPLSEENFANYIQNAMKLRGLTISKEIVHKLSSILPFQASAVENALDQLALNALNGEIRQEDLSHIAVNTVELDVFAYVEKLENQKSFDIWRDVLHDNNRAKEVYFAFISSLTKQARQMWQILSHETPNELKPYPLQIRSQTANRLGRKRVAYLFLLLREGELSIKTGKKDIAQAMEELICDLSTLYKV